MKATPLAHRFWPKVQVASTIEGCWPWRGARTPAGYGNVYDGSRTEKAHRAAYLLTFGPVAAEAELDHLCGRRDCVNPWHLQLVTHAENLRRSRPAVATHCPRGHEYAEHRDRRNRRFCRKCRQIRDKKRRSIR